MAVISEQTVSMVMSLMEYEFDRCMVMDEETRRVVARRLIEGTDFIGDALGKYEMDELLRGRDPHGDSQVDEVCKTIKLDMELSADQQSRLVNGNKDVRLIFDQGITMPHAYYFAQRIIDTDRCIRSLAHYGGEIGDIGGNYAAHTRQGRIFHSCTLLNDAREAHRQMERDVRLMGDGYALDTLDRCQHGAEVCTKKYNQSMSIHAITCIPADNWPEIMERHGCNYHVAVFHYDPVMLIHDEGFLPGREMYYKVTGDSVSFHFESDSSLGYSHPWKNFLQYVKPWCKFSADKQWAYLYDLKHVGDGVATAEIVKVPASDIGIQIKKPMFAYVPREQVVHITSYFYDVSLGSVRTDASAFVKKTMAVDRDFYRYMYVYGVSNDSANPNSLLTIREFRDMAATYNSTRRFGDATLTRRCVSGLEASDVYDALYHYIARRRAVMAVRAAALTNSMMGLQRSAGIEVASILAWLPLTATGAVLVMAGGVFKYYYDQAIVACKKACSNRLRLATKDDVTSYIPIPGGVLETYEGYHPDNEFSFEREYEMVPSIGATPLSGDLLEKLFDESLAGLASPVELTDEVFLGKPVITKDVEPDTATSKEDHGTNDKGLHMRRDGEMEIISDATLRDVLHSTALSLNNVETLNFDYKKVHVALLDKYRTSYTSGGVVKLGSIVTPDLVQLHEHAINSMIEFAVYSFDVGYGAIATLKRIAAELFVGDAPDMSRLRNMNDGQDLGVVVSKVVNGQIVGGQMKDSVAVDPKTGVIHQVIRSSEGDYRIGDKGVQYLVAAEVTRVFNSYAIARGVLKSINRGYMPRFEMHLIDGVPGCGKTTEIVNSFGVDDVVLCTVKHSRDDTLARVAKKMEGIMDEATCGMRIRTLDSMIMHGYRLPGAVETVFLDEGLMAFPGQLYAALERVRPRVVRVFGDRCQITAVDRSLSLGELRFQGLAKWTSIETRDVSFSMPADVCVALSKHFYHRPIYTVSPVKRSMVVVPHKSVTDADFTAAAPGVDYLTVLTADKAKLLCGHNFVDGKKSSDLGEVKSRVLTVHEAQGQRLSVVSVVRLNPNTASVLNSKTHVTVGVSRHYLRAVYHKIGESDLMEQVFSTPVIDEEMVAIMKPSPEWLVDKIRKLRAKY